MKTRIRITLAVTLLGAITLFSSSVKAQGNKTAAPASGSKETYEALVKRVKGGDLKIDFGAMRQAFTESKGFSRFGSAGKREMFATLNAKKFTEALALAEKQLDTNYVDLNAHYIAFASNRALKNEDKAKFHLQMFQGLVQSIVDGHDGQSPATAYSVISIDEEHVVITYLEFVYAGKQALMEDKGHHYDMMTVTDPKTKKETNLYFEIDRFYGF